VGGDADTSKAVDAVILIGQNVHTAIEWVITADKCFDAQRKQTEQSAASQFMSIQTMCPMHIRQAHLPTRHHRLPSIMHSHTARTQRRLRRLRRSSTLITAQRLTHMRLYYPYAAPHYPFPTAPKQLENGEGKKKNRKGALLPQEALNSYASHFDICLVLRI
jgi:hypothetical protein